MVEFAERSFIGWDEGQWREFFSSIVNYTVQGQENVDDVIEGGWQLGRHRAEVNQRHFIIIDDVPFSLSLFCWYPLRPGIHEESYDYLLENRFRVFEGISRTRDVEHLFAVVPEEILKLNLNQLFGLLQVIPIQNVLRL